MDEVTATDVSSLVGETTGGLAEIFGAATAGAIPDGRGKGTMLLGTGGRAARVAAALCYGLAWRGKVVNARAGRLKNIVTPLGIHAIEAAVYKQASWYDGQPCIVLDYSKTSLVARKVRDEIREISPDVFLGLVFWGRRHVLDFALDFRQQP